MKKVIKKYLKDKAGVEAMLRHWVKDRGIPLKGRWATFIKSGFGDDVEFGGYGPGPLMKMSGDNGISWYDDFYMDRGGPGKVAEMVDALGESLYGHNYGARDGWIVTKEGIDEFKEWCLANFCSTITNDW